jgi:TAP42-like family.
MVDTNPVNQSGGVESDIDDFFHKEEEISENFDFVQKSWMEYEDCQVNLPYEDAIKLLKKIEKSIIYHGLFSPNEELKEIPTENLK